MDERTEKLLRRCRAAQSGAHGGHCAFYWFYFGPFAGG
jgi:hypothetical protein